MTITFGQRIKAWRADRGLTQRELAATAGVSEFTIGNVERDEHASVSATTLARLASAFGCSSEDLIRATAAPVSDTAQRNNSSQSGILDQPPLNTREGDADMSPR